MRLDRGGRPRRLNRPLVKGVVMHGWSAAFGLWSGLTGIASQLVTEPFCRFMLGWVPEKSAATSHLAGWVASATFLVTWLLRHHPLSIAAVAATSAGAVMGALLTSKAHLNPFGRRVAASLLVLLSVWVLGEAVRNRFGGPLTLSVDLLKGPAGYALAGLAAGLISQAGLIPIGALLVPLMVFACGADLSVAVATTTASAVIAGALPLAAYVATDRIDRLMWGWMAGGASIGACAAALILTSSIGSRSPQLLAVFAVTSMLAGAWMAWRSTQ